MTPEQLKIKPFKPIIKVNTNQELDTNEGESIKDEEESITSTELTQDSKPTETLQIHNVCNTTTHAKDELPESEEKSVIEFEINENGEKDFEKENKLSNPEPKLKVLSVFFIENKQQDDSVHLFTIIKRIKLKSTHQCLSIEYIFSQQGDYILNNNPINTHIDCFKQH